MGWPLGGSAVLLLSLPLKSAYNSLSREASPHYLLASLYQALNTRGLAPPEAACSEMPSGSRRKEPSKCPALCFLQGSPEELQDRRRGTAGLRQQCSCQHDVTRQGDEFPVRLGGRGGAPERGIPSRSFIPALAQPLLPSPPPLPPPSRPGIGFGAGSAPQAISSAGRQARAVLDSELAFSESPGLARSWPTAPGIHGQRRVSCSVKERPPKVRTAAGSCAGAGGGAGHGPGEGFLATRAARRRPGREGDRSGCCQGTRPETSRGSE